MPFFSRERHSQPKDSNKPPKTSHHDVQGRPHVAVKQWAHQQASNISSLSVATPPPPYPSSNPYQHDSRPHTSPAGWHFISPHVHHLTPSQNRPPQAQMTVSTAKLQLQQPQYHTAWQSTSNLVATAKKPIAAAGHKIPIGRDHAEPNAALCNIISNKFDDVITLIDEEVFKGGEKELIITHEVPVYDEAPQDLPRSADHFLRGREEMPRAKASKGANCAITTAITSTNYFSKANLYANSRLPPNLPALHVYMPTYPLMCLAAQYSQRVYVKPHGEEKDAHVEADWRMGTKAMVVKSVPIDDMNTVVFAIRGTQTFMDWAVNLKSSPTSPTGFLDDPGNLCHAGFLAVARKTVKPVAQRLRQMLEENPNRASCSLLITGHSAGGAVASLLYCHMLSETVNSELSILTGCFKRVHCITFGAPPVSLLPLAKPLNRERRLQKSLFLSFINEGDPVPRADKAYVRSLLDLYTSPAPKPASRPLPAPNGPTSNSRLDLSLHALTAKKKPSRLNLRQRPATAPAREEAVSNIFWEVPPSILSNAGRLVVLRAPRSADGKLQEEDVHAYITTDEQMRSVVFGDPLMHEMGLYAKRIEIIATKAVTGRLGT